MTTDDRPIARAVMRRMSGTQRLTLGIAGLALTAAGLVSVFLSDNQLGSAALIVVGAVLLTVGTVGLMPMRISYKDAQLVLAEITEFLAENEGAETAKRILEKAEAIVPGSVAEATRDRVQAALAYEDAVFRALERLGGNALSVDFRVRREGINVDAVATQGDRRVYIEVKSAGGTRSGTWKRTQDMVHRAVMLRGPWLLITDTPLTVAQTHRLSEAGVRHVMWRGESDDESLRHALQTLLMEPREE